MDGDAADVLALARVQAGANADPRSVGRLEDRASATDRARRAVERREEAVADRLDLATLEAAESLSDPALVALEQLSPALVAQLGGRARGVDDVGEQHRGEDALGLGL